MEKPCMLDKNMPSGTNWVLHGAINYKVPIQLLPVYFSTMATPGTYGLSFGKIHLTHTSMLGLICCHAIE